MITSNLARDGHASRVKILCAAAEGRRSGLLTDSVVMTDNLATVTHTDIHRVVGSLPMAKVDQALRHTLAL
jgi:mRNA interferase MazF